MSIDRIVTILSGLGIRRLNVYGEVLKGVCPFHDGSSGKTFWLHPESGSWGCWSTRCPKHNGGNLTQLAQALGATKMDQHFLESFKKSLSSYQVNGLKGLPMGAEAFANPSNIRDLDEQGKVQESHVLTWHNNLKTNITPDLVNFLEARAIPLNLLLFFKAGFAKNSNALIFPLRSAAGELLGIVRRKAVEGERYYFSGSPYPNNHPSYRYHRVNKGQVLWGLHESRENLSESDTVVVVEGIFDVLRLASYGVRAVAKLGAKLTDDQVEILLNLDCKLVLWPDKDVAGITGTAEDISRLLLHPNLRCVIPKTSDPGDTEEIDAQHALASTVNAPEFLSRITELLY